MRDEQFKLGRIFTVPLLGGGFGFGYLTYYNKGLMMLVNVFDVLSSTSTPPANIETAPVLRYDLSVGAEFLLTAKASAGERWKFTDRFVEGDVKPRNRYYRMGSVSRGFKRIDILREEPDVALAIEEHDKYPIVENRFAPGPTAEIEVALKRLTISSEALIDEWRAGRSAS